MAHTVVGNTITLTGTNDVDYLLAIPEVIASGSGSAKEALFDGYYLVNDGVLDINPFFEKLRFINVPGTKWFTNNATVNVNGYRSYFGREQYSRGVWLESDHTGANIIGFYNAPGATLNLVGGTLKGREGVDLDGTVVLNEANFDCLHVNLLRLFTADITFAGRVYIQGFRIGLLAQAALANLVVRGYSGIDCVGGGRTPQTSEYYLVENYLADDDSSVINLRYFNSFELRDADLGTQRFGAPAVVGADHGINGGIGKHTKTLQFIVSDVDSGLGIDAAKVIVKSYDDGARFDYSNLWGVGWNFLNIADEVLTCDSAGQTPQHLHLLAAQALPTTDALNDYEETYFSKNGDNTDLFDVIGVAYSQDITLRTPAFKGNGVLDVAIEAFADSNIVDTKANVAAYPITIDLSNNTLTITGNGATLQTLTADQLYDACSLYLENNPLKIFDYPGTVRKLVDKSGAEINTVFQDFDITLDYITFDGSLTLNNTKTLTLLNGSTVSGVVADSNGTTGKLTLYGLVNQNVYVENDSAVQQDYVQDFTGDYTLQIPAGVTGIWKWAIKNAGYEQATGTFSVANGGEFSAAPVTSQITNPNGSAMYAGSSSSLVDVDFTGVTQGNIRIGNGTASLQATFDETERALETAQGLAWIASGKSGCRQFNSAGGDYFFMSTGWRLVRRLATDAESTLNAFAQSADGIVEDSINGTVRFLSSDSPDAIASAVIARMQTVNLIEDDGADKRFTANALENNSADVADSVWDEPYAEHKQAGTFGKLFDNLRKANLTVDGVVTGTPTVSQFDTNLTNINGAHDHQVLLFVSGALTAEGRPIETYANGTIVLQEPLTQAPTANDEFVILPHHVHPISEIQEGLATQASLDSVDAKMVETLRNTKKITPGGL